MVKKEEKKVEYLELIYDLIFVYMIGRDNALLHTIRNGFVEPQAFLIYTCCTLAIIQIWSFTTFYINMFGRNGLRDHIFLLTNMYLLYFLGEATRMDAAAYTAQYHVAWCLILINIGMQYVIELRNHKMDVWNRDVIRRMSITLFSEAAVVFVGGLFPNPVMIALSFGAVFTGIVLTEVSRLSSAGGQVDFMHLTERAMLYVVFTFGEMVIAVAEYFTGDGGFHPRAIYFSLMAFLVAVGLFLSYEIVYDYLVDREKECNGLAYMVSHIFIIFALSNVTVAFEFMREEEISVLPKILLLVISLVAYFLFLFMLKGHFKLRCQLKRSFIAKMALISAVFIAAMILLRNNMVLNILLSVAYVFTIVLVLWKMKAVQDEVKRRKESEER